MNTTTPLVAIRCATYNHEPYIRQCLEGFVMQKTNFPFVAIVHDDASTDGTAAIIREFEEKYPDIIKPIYETENQYSKGDGSLGRAMDNATPKEAKYLAYCEGDDYWIDPNKLQMQVNFLEANPEYGMCYTKANVFIQKDSNLANWTIGEYIKDFNDLLFYDNRIPTLTSVVKKNLYEKYRNEICPPNKHWLMGDYPMWLYITNISKINFIPKSTSVYRVLQESASHSNDISKNIRFYSSRDDIRNFFLRKYTDKKYDFHAETAWKYAQNKIYPRKVIVDEFKKADFLSKKDKRHFFIAKNPVLFFLYRFRKDVKSILCKMFAGVKKVVKHIPVIGTLLLKIKRKIKGTI